MKRHFEDSFLVFELEGSLSESEVQPLADALENELDKGNLQIALDFSTVFHVSIFVLGIIAKFWKRFSERHGKLIILNPTLGIRNLLMQTRLDGIIPIIRNEESLKVVL